MKLKFTVKKILFGEEDNGRLILHSKDEVDRIFPLKFSYPPDDVLGLVGREVVLDGTELSYNDQVIAYRINLNRIEFSVIQIGFEPITGGPKNAS